MPEYLLDRVPVAVPGPPALDDAQRAVIEHRGGPLLVLAGPGAGKTTTLVELVVDRVENQGLRPEQILVLTFSRKAANEIRSRIARRLARTMTATPAMTFHSFCYALLRSEQEPDTFAQPIRLLGAPEYDAVLREILDDTDPSAWPAELRPALGKRGMASELREFFAAARAQGMDAGDVVDAAERLGRPDWAAVGGVFDEVASVAALANTIDHTDLVFQAVRTLEDPRVRARWRERIALVIVDEYQDTDPLQVELLQALAGDGRDLVVVGDPYQSIYGFRGADVRGILDFPERFGAPTITLSHTNRYGPTIAAAVRSIVENRGAVGAADGHAFAQLRNPASRRATPGDVQVCTYSSATAESEHIALALREAHLHDGMPWDEMAVLVRTGADVGRLQRALAAAGVPVTIAGDELPLAAEPAVRSLLAALHAADALRRGVPIGPEQAEALLTGPIGNLDAAAMRRLGRALRQAEPDRPRSSRLLIAEALSQPVHLRTLDVRGPSRDAADRAARLAELLHHAAGQIAAGDSPEQVLWTLWDGTRWPVRLQAEAEGHSDGAARANHDLDTVCQLFVEAARAEERSAHRSVGALADSLEAQQIPAGAMTRDSEPVAAVQVMTAHRSKGLEWPFVVVAGVQEGVWPAVRARSSLLQAERFAPDQVLAPPSPRTLLAEERRLFYVAASRARRRLLVTAVADASDAGDQPSRFVAELHAHLTGSSQKSLPMVQHRPRRALSLRGTVAELRRLGETDDPAVRERAAELLAMLAQHPAGRAAHPDRWWGLAARTQSQVPVRDPDQPLQLSGSQIEQLGECPLRWFLSHEARGSVASTSAQGFGSIVHALAADVFGRDEVPSLDEFGEHLDSVWGALGLPEWVGHRERAAAMESLERFLVWHSTNPRTLLAVEQPFEVGLDIDGRAVTLSGSMDRVELDGAGVHVVDLKTAKRPPGDVSEHAQLGVYQLAVQAGAAAGLADSPAGGAELVQLRKGAKGAPEFPQVQVQPAPSQHFFALELVRESARLIAEETFVAVVNDHCGFCEFQTLCPTTDSGGSIL